MFKQTNACLSRAPVSVNDRAKATVFAVAVLLRLVVTRGGSRRQQRFLSEYHHTSEKQLPPNSDQHRLGALSFLPCCTIGLGRRSLKYPQTAPPFAELRPQRTAWSVLRQVQAL